MSLSTSYHVVHADNGRVKVNTLDTGAVVEVVLNEAGARVTSWTPAHRDQVCIELGEFDQ